MSKLGILTPPGYEIAKPSIYTHLNHSAAYAAIVHLERNDLLSLLSSGQLYDTDIYNFPHPDRILGSLNFLYDMSLVDEKGDCFKLTQSGKEFIQYAMDIYGEYVNTYTDLASLTEEALGWRKEIQHAVPDIIEYRSSDIENIRQYTLFPVSIAFFNEYRVQEGKYSGKTLSEICMDAFGKKESLNFESLISKDIAHADLIKEYIQVCINQGLLEGEYNRANVTKNGAHVFYVSAFAVLHVSYNSTMQNLDLISSGEKTYGYGKDVNRLGEYNARGSNGIIGIRVAAQIQDVVNEMIGNNKSNKEIVTIDLGSGGGLITEKMLWKEENGKYVRNNVKIAYGMDISHEAIAAAEKYVKEKGVEDSVHFIQGDITKWEDYDRLKEMIYKNHGENTLKYVTENFITHESEVIGKGILREVGPAFPDDTIFITESFKIDREIRRKRWNYQAAIFNFYHEISGQHLWKKEELMNLFSYYGYTVLEDKVKVHSSISGMTDHPKDKIDTIATFPLRYTGHVSV